MTDSKPEFRRVCGDLFVGRTAEEDERYNGDRGGILYKNVVFDAEMFQLHIDSLGYLPVEESHFTDVDGSTVYFPYQNETDIEPTVQDTSDLDLYAKKIEIEYTIVDSTVYIKSQNEVPSYVPTYLIDNGEIYEITDTSLLFDSEEEFREDQLLDHPSRSGSYVMVENISTGVRVPVTRETVYELIENSDPNGLVRLSEVQGGFSKKIAENL